MIKPRRLRPGDTVAVVSLSSGMAGEAPFRHRFDRGCGRLKSEFGLEVKVMPNALKGMRYLYENPQARARDFMDAFLDPKVGGIFCAIGGDDTVRLLPYIDLDVIRANPKIFMGYSDATANHFMMYKAGVTSFHGPAVMAEFAENVEMHTYTKEHIKQVLFAGMTPLSICSSPMWTSEYLEWTDIRLDSVKRTMRQERYGHEILQGRGTVRGELLGGNTSVMNMIIGTDIWPSREEWRGKILFLETAEDLPTPDFLAYLLRNLLTQGILGMISGIVVGKPYHERYYCEYRDVYRKIAAEAGRADLPILYNVNCSHTAPVCILPYGVQAEISCEERTLTIVERAVCG